LNTLVKLNTFRRIVQWSAIFIVLALSLISRGSALNEAYGRGASHVEQLAGAWDGFLYQAFAYLFGNFEDATAVADLFQGGYWSLTLFGFTISDPLALFGYMVAHFQIHWPLVLGAAIPLGIAFFAGRLFCGWICPVNTLLELNARFRGWLEKWVDLPHFPQGLIPPSARTAVLLAGLVVSAAAGFNAFSLILPYVGLVRDWHLSVYNQAIGYGTLFFLVLVLVELFLSPRVWCRSLCPTGLVLETVGRWRMLGVLRKPQAVCANNCHACIAACPIGVNPRDEIALERCMVCNACIDICPEDVLETKLARPKRKRSSKIKPAAILGLALLVLSSSGAKAHHIKGLPHYGYLENYPQTPTRETIISAAPFSVSLVIYALEGIDPSKADLPDDTMIFVSVTDTRTAKAYKGPISIALQLKGGGERIARNFSAPLEETVYRMRASLPGAAYNVAIKIGGPDAVVARAQITLDDGISSGLGAIIALIVAGGLAIGVMGLRRRLRRKALTPPIKGGNTAPGLGRRDMLRGKWKMPRNDRLRISAIRPPGSVSRGDFYTLCDGCALCAQSCPANAIRMNGPKTENDASSPQILAATMACVMCDGLVCAKACPTGAMKPITPKTMRIAKMKLDAVKCQDRRDMDPECNYCFDRCPLRGEAITYGFRKGPEIQEQVCTGCGTCLSYCPAKPIALSQTAL
jgi:ferredoxin-type protein NapH